jgi:hypothetical protein
MGAIFVDPGSMRQITDAFLCWQRMRLDTTQRITLEKLAESHRAYLGIRAKYIVKSPEKVPSCLLI